MPRLEVRYDTGTDALVVGELLSVGHRIYFQYAADFRARGIELSPFRLPTSIATPTEESTRSYQGLHGLFNDSLPDGWGLILMAWALRARGIEPERITPLDRLAYIGSRGMGALTYHPPADASDRTRLAVDLAALAAQSQRILDGSAEELLPVLLRTGGSPMGARPKVVVGVSADHQHLVTGDGELPVGYAHWLIKFASREDPADVGAIEFAYAEMARLAGIAVPPTHLFHTSDGRHCFGVQRFDRDPLRPARRHHLHSMAGLLDHDHRVPGQDYRDLLTLTRVLTRTHQDVREAFRRMVFNILAHNRDDHTKNTAFLMSPHGEWRLAPAYDLTFSHGPGGEHTMLVAGEGAAPTRRHVRAVSDAASLEAREQRELVQAVEDAIAQWPALAAAAEVTAASQRTIQRRLNEVRSSFAG